MPKPTIQMQVTQTLYPVEATLAVPGQPVEIRTYFLTSSGDQNRLVNDLNARRYVKAQVKRAETVSQVAGAIADCRENLNRAMRAAGLRAEFVPMVKNQDLDAIDYKLGNHRRVPRFVPA